MRGGWRLVAGPSDVPAVWLRRLLRQVKEQARPRAFPRNWPSLDPALQRAGYELGVVLRGRGASRPDMSEVLFAGALRIAMKCARRPFRRRAIPDPPDIDKMRPKPVEPERPFAHMMVRVGRRRPKPLSAETTLSNQLAGHRWLPCRYIVADAVRHGAHPVTRFCLTRPERPPRLAQYALGSSPCVARLDRL